MPCVTPRYVVRNGGQSCSRSTVIATFVGCAAERTRPHGPRNHDDLDRSLRSLI